MFGNVLIHEIKTKCRQESILFATFIMFYYPDEKAMWPFYVICENRLIGKKANQSPWTALECKYAALHGRDYEDWHPLVKN